MEEEKEEKEELTASLNKHTRVYDTLDYSPN
jgi:hypothetical protein